MQVDYNGHQIVVTDDLDFQVKGPLVQTEEVNYNDRRFPSVAEARAFIDRLQAAARKSAAGGDKIELEMLDGRGHAFICRGINRTSRRLLGMPEGSRYDIEGASGVYPDTPGLKAVLQERARLRHKIAEIDRQISPFRVPEPRGYGRVEPEAYGGLLTTLKEGYAVARSRAEASTPKETEDEKAT